MILGCVTWKGVLRLLRLSMVIISYAKQYYKILVHVARHFPAGNYLFQQGKAPVYRLMYVAITFLHEKNIITISWRAFKCNWKSWASDPDKASDTGREDGSKEDISVRFRIDWNHKRLCQITISFHNPQIT